MSTVETSAAPVTARPSPKPRTKKAAAKKPAPKPKDKKPKATEPGLNPIRWSEKKIELLRALRKGKALDPLSAITKERIAEVSGGKALTGLSPKYDLTVQGYVKPCQTEESRQYIFHITKKGLAILSTNK